MTDQEIIKNLKNKIQNPKNDTLLINIIHNFFISKKDKSWNLRNVNLIGFGEIVASNNQLLRNSIGLDYKNAESANQLLILQNNSTKEYNGLLLPPSSVAAPYEGSVLPWGFTCFDEIRDGVQDKANWILSNIVEEEIEIKPWKLKSPVGFYTLLNNRQLKCNDIMINNLDKDEETLISDVVDQLDEKERTR